MFTDRRVYLFLEATAILSLKLAIWQHTLISGFMPHIAETLTKLACNTNHMPLY